MGTFSNEMIFEWKLNEGGKSKPWKYWLLVGSIAGRESFKYKGLEKVAYVACSGNSVEASGDGAE